MAGDDFALVVVGDTDWTWDLDAVVAGIAATWPDANVQDGHPLVGSTYRVFAYLPDPRAGRNMEVDLADSGRMIRWNMARRRSALSSSPGSPTLSTR